MKFVPCILCTVPVNDANRKGTIHDDCQVILDKLALANASQTSTDLRAHEAKIVFAALKRMAAAQTPKPSPT